MSPITLSPPFRRLEVQRQGRAPVKGTLEPLTGVRPIATCTHYGLLLGKEAAPTPSAGHPEGPARRSGQVRRGVLTHVTQVSYNTCVTWVGGVHGDQGEAHQVCGMRRTGNHCEG